MGIMTFGTGNSNVINTSPQKEVLTTIKEVIKEVPVEVIKEVEIIKEVPVEVIKEVIKEVPIEVIKEVIVEKIKAVEVKVVDSELTEKLQKAVEANINLKQSDNELKKQIQELQVSNQVINEKIVQQGKMFIIAALVLLGLVLFV